MAVSVVQVPVVFAGYNVDEKSSEIGLMGANVKDSRDLVAIVVSEDVWNNSQEYVGLSEKYDEVSEEELRDRVERYVKDVQKVLPKTNTMILPVSGGSESVLKVRQVLEKLYLDGTEVGGRAVQLSGVVLIGEVPLPVVMRGAQSFISLLPYTDFVEPSYVFDADLQRFVRGGGSTSAPKPEIWHGVIRPPVSGESGMKQLAEYLDKNHLYHSGHKDFSEFGKKILYSDLVTESKQMSRVSFPRYQNFLKNMEDLTYHRFSAKWLAALQKEFDTTPEGTGGAVPVSDFSTTDVPDIQTAQPIQSYHVSYPELFGTFLNSITDFVTGSGRWSEDEVESIPALIAKKDAFAAAHIRETNDAIEEKIDSELEALQKPLPLYRDTTVEGVVRYQQPGSVGLLKSIASTLSGKITSKDYLIGGGKFVFLNNSMIAGAQYVNGVFAGDITRGQQCSMYGGSLLGTGTMTRFIRSLNPLTVNVSGATGAAGDSDNAKNPGLLPTLGVTTRTLTASEASTLSNGNVLHGAIVEMDKDLSLPAKFAAVGLNAGDILLDIDGVTIDEEHPVGSLLQTRSVGQKAKVGVYRAGKTMSVDTIILDGNADGLVAGCYGINYNNEKNVIAGKEKRKCFPLAASYPVADHSGTVAVSSVAGLSLMDRGLSCSSFRAQKPFEKFLNEVREYLTDSREDGPEGLTVPELPTQDPAKILLLEKKGFKDFVGESLSGKVQVLEAPPQDFSLQQFLDLQGVMNEQDDNGDYFDSNKNGKTDQIAWIDYNGNGKLDLWIHPKVTGSSVNVVSLPGEDDLLSSLFKQLPLSLSVEEYRAKFPQFFQGAAYTGAYTGEFVGGDFGVDEPSELVYGFKPLGSSEVERWGHIQKKYLEAEAPVVYATPRRAPTQQEYRAHIQAMQKAKPSLKLDLLNVLYGGNSCVSTGVGCGDESLQIQGLKKSTSDIWMRFSSSKEKDISSVGHHKEPTAGTLRAQFNGVLAAALPIDNPRHATFLDKLGLEKTFIYPNVFSVSDDDELVKRLGESEKKLSEYGSVKSEGWLAGMFDADQIKKIRSVLEWRGLSLDQKHARVMAEYLNPQIDGYVDDSPLGYEAMYFVANGKPSSYATDFSGEGILNEDDEQYLAIMSGENVQGGGSIVATKEEGVTIAGGAESSVNGGSSGGSSNSEGIESSVKKILTEDSPSKGSSEDPDIVDLDKWLGAMDKWLDDLKKSFKPLGLSLTSTGGYDSLVAPGEALASLKISLPKKDLMVGGEGVTVEVIGFDAKGSLATGDHTSLVRLDVASGGGGTKVIPDASDMPDGGVFLSQGRASFQIIPGKKPETLVLRGRAIVAGGLVSSESVTVKIGDAKEKTETGSTPSAAPAEWESGEPYSISVSSQSSILTKAAQEVEISLSDQAGHRIEGQLASYDIRVSGPAEVSGVDDLDSKRDGYQVESLGEPVRMTVTPTAAKGEVTISVSSGGDDSAPITGSLTLPIRNDLSLSVSSNVGSMKVDASGETVAIVTAKVVGAGGSVVSDYSGPVHFSIDDERLGTFASKAPSQFSHGQATVVVRSGTRSGVAHVMVESAGLGSAQSAIVVTPLSASSVKVVNAAKTLGLAAGTNVVVNVVDQYGNPATENSLPIAVRLTEKTAKFGNLRSSTGVLSKNMVVYAQQGAGIFTVQAGESAGLIHLVVGSPGLAAAAHEITVSGENGLGMISDWNPSVLYGSILGGPFGKVSEPNYLAGSVLFAGKMQAAAAVTTDAKPRHNILSIGAYGGVTIHDQTAAGKVLQSGEGDPLRITLTTNVGKNSVGDLIIKRDGKASEYVTMTDPDDVRFSFVPDSADEKNGAIVESDKPLLRVYGSGGVQILDSKVTVSLSQSSGKFMMLDVKIDSNVVAMIRIPFDAVNPLTMLTSPPASYAALPVGVWLVNQIHNEDHVFEPSYTGFSSNEPAGYRLVSTLTTDLTSNDIVGSSSVSLEDAASVMGVGFSTDNKHMLLLAGGNSVGEAHLSYASEIGIVLGDPTVKLSEKNIPANTSMGFGLDVGKNIGVIASGAKVLLPLDVNSDGKKDLLVGNSDGSVRYFQYTGGPGKFRDRGELLRAKNGIFDAAVGDIDADGDEDIVIAVKESCTVKETCVDVYRNVKGSFVRENLGLNIPNDRRVAVMRLIDLNADGIPDLLVSLTNGEVMVFYAMGGSGGGGKGIFESVGQLIGSFNVSPGQRVLISAGTSIASSIDPQDPDVTDSFADIFVQPEGSSNAKLIYFIAKGSASLKGGHVAYRRVEVDTGPSTSGAMNTLKDDLGKILGGGSSLEAAGKSMGLLRNENNKDANHDGVPDYIDGSGGEASGGGFSQEKADKVINSVKSTIKKLRCGEGCLPLPINFAFLAPGPINVNGKAVGDDPLAIPVFGAAGGCTPWPIWPPCPYENKAQTFRIYVSPTLTGQVGFGICFGGSYKNGRCYAFAPNISLIPKGLCKAISQKMSTVMKKASSFGSSSGGSGGFTSMIAGGGKKFPSTDTTNKHTNVELLQGYSAEVNVAANIRIPGFPAAFTDWLDRQIEEIVDKLTDLPDLYLMYPDLGSIGSAVIPQMSSSKITGYTTFLAWLNSVPLIQIEPKPVSIILPALTKGQILKLQANLGSWLNDFTLEVGRVKALLGCDKASKEKHVVDICGLIDVKANITFKKVNANFKALDSYKEFPRKLIEYRNIEAKYIGQIINYLNTVTQFVGGYVRRQEKRLGAWMSMITEVKKALGQWQAVVDVTQKYAENCDSCKTERGSLFPVLLNAFVNIPPPPIIPFPKWPDIVMDFSRIETGVKIVWPDLTFSPKQVLLPTLPSVKLPLDVDMIARLGGVPKLNSVHVSKITVDLNAAFDSYIPDLPELPALPVLPNLPDLPPLPAFKLPDIPPAPRIPKLNQIKGVNLSKSLKSIKNLLEIVCLIKKGYVIVDEDSKDSNLKTMIEQLTQRSLTPPLSIDLEKTVTYPPIKYDAIEQVILKGKMKFELGTDVIYKMFKTFADEVNNETTDLVRGTNSLGEKVTKEGKKLGSFDFDADSNQIRLVAEQVPVDISELAVVDVIDGASNVSSSVSSVLSRQLSRYLADHGNLDVDTGGESGRLSRYIAQVGESDGADGGVGVRTVALATDSADNSKAGAGSASAVADVYGDYAEDASEPAGLFISNPSTGNAEKIVAYTLEVGRDPIMSQVDADNDGDIDVFYSFGSDIYFKENQTKKASDAFEEFNTSDPIISSLEKWLPVAGSVTGVSFDDSQRDLITLSWNASIGSVVGYELELWSAENGLQRRRYLLPGATGQIPYHAGIMTEEIADEPTLSVSFSLPYGHTYFQIVPLSAGEIKGTASSVYLFAPQICGNSSAPIVSLGDGDVKSAYSVALGKVLKMNLSGVIDAKSEIVKYAADSDLSTDSNGDGNMENDRDVSSDDPSLALGPYYREAQVRVKIFAENAHGTVSEQVLSIQVYVPNIVLKHASAQDGSVSGFITPGEEAVPLSLVRERGSNAEIIGDYMTDSVGNFVVSGLQTSGKTVIRNMKGEIVAEYESATGKFRAVRSGYSLRARISSGTYQIIVELIDSAGVVLASSFTVPDVNTDVTIDDSALSYTPVTVGSMRGVHVADRSADDGVAFKRISSDDPMYFGGVEVVSGSARLAVVDSSGRIFVSDPRVTIRLRERADMPYLYDLLLDSKVIGEIFIAAKIPSKPIVLDPKEFSVSIDSSGVAGQVAAAVAAIPLSSSGSGSTFADVAPGTELSRAVSLLKEDGIIEGYQENGATVFKPDQAILRAEYTKIVLKALCIVPRSSAYQSPSPFSDITFTQPPSWYYPFVKESYLRNLITGYTGEKNALGIAPFKPLAYISRAESVKILIEALRMLGVIRLDSVKLGADEAWFVPFMRVAQNLKPYLASSGMSPNDSAIKESFIVTPSESQSPNYRMTRGDFAIMAARVLKTYDCYQDAREARRKQVEQENLLLQKKADEARKIADTQAKKALDAKRAAAYSELQKTLATKTSRLGSGVYVFLPVCISCPCLSVIEQTGQLLPGDKIFAILSTKDHATIFKKSNVIILPVSPQ